MLYQERDGRIWLLFVLLKGDYWTSAALYGACSDDEGASWSPARLVYDVVGTMVRHPPAVGADGLVLLPVYDERQREALLLAQRADGGAWREAFRFHELPLLQPVLVADGTGPLTLLFRPWSDPRQIWRSQSVEGRQWSAPVRTPLPCPLSGIAAFVLPGRLAAVYNHTDDHRRHPLSIALSRDGGVSWEAPWHFERVRHEVSYPQFHARADGGAHGVYSYNRRLIKYVTFEASELA